MTLMEVTNLGQSEDPKKKVYSVTLKSVYEDTVDMKVTLKSESKSALERIIPLVVGERRDLDILDPNTKLDDFVAKEPAATVDHSMEIFENKMATLPTIQRNGEVLAINELDKIDENPFSEEDL